MTFGVSIVVTYITFNHRRGQPFSSFWSWVDNLDSMCHIPAEFSWVMRSLDSEKSQSQLLWLMKSCVFMLKIHEVDSSVRSEFLTQIEPTPDRLRALSAELLPQFYSAVFSIVCYSEWLFSACAFLHTGMSFAFGPGNNRKLSVCTIEMSFFSQKS